LSAWAEVNSYLFVEKVEYEGKLENGDVFDSTQHGDHSHPLEFEVGAGQIIPGFENAVIGMEIGEEKEIKLQPQDAYGNPNPDLVQKVPRNQLPKVELKEGTLLALTIENGAQIPATITEVTDEIVTIDLNSPLAGKILNFKIKVLDVSS